MQVDEIAEAIAQRIDEIQKEKELQISVDADCVLNVAVAVVNSLEQMKRDLAHHKYTDGIATTKHVALAVYWGSRLRPIKSGTDKSGEQIGFFINEAVFIDIGLNWLFQSIISGKIARVLQEKSRCHGSCKENDCISAYCSRYFGVANLNAAGIVYHDKFKTDDPQENLPYETAEDEIQQPQNFEYIVQALICGQMSVEALAIMFDQVLYGGCLFHEPLSSCST